MLSFRVHQLQVGPWHYILLPRMNSAQIQLLRTRFARQGYSVEASRFLTARSKEGTIHLDPAGICWATNDPADALLPALPDILATSRERIPPKSLESMYLSVGRSSGKYFARVSTRVERYSSWDTLRATGGCGLAPDEHVIMSFLLSRSRDGCQLLTDFFAGESKARFCGKRLYFDSVLDPSEAARTLRSVGGRASRNSYLHRDGLLRLGGYDRPSTYEWSELFAELGDWCGFVPA